jgi:predicted ferric reductase
VFDEAKVFTEPRMTLLDLCAYLGLGAVAFAAVNLQLGVLMAMRYSPTRLWPHRHVNVFLLHQWTAYLAVALTIAHPIVLLFQHVAVFRLIDILWPIHSPLQPWVNIAGAAALYLLLMLLITSLLRNRIGRRLWRSLHYLAFPMVVLSFLHSILTDPDLRTGHPDYLDGGKIFLYAATLLSILAVIVRIRLRGRGLRPAPTAPAPSSTNLTA